MLLEFSISNFKSIGSEVVYSALSTKDDSHRETLLSLNKGKDVFANKGILYGANGSGKSALFEAVAFLKNQVVKSAESKPGDGIYVPSHKNLGPKTPSTFALQFERNGIRYAYGFSLKDFLVEDEYLYYFPNGRHVRIFERTGDHVILGTKFKSSLSNALTSLKQNKLFLSVAAVLSKSEEVESAFRFFNEDLIYYSAGNPLSSDNWFNYSLQQMYEDSSLKQKVLQFMNDLGFQIADLEISLEQGYLDVSEIPPFLSDEFKARLLKNTVNKLKANVVYKDFSLDLFSEESSGIKKLFEFLCPYFYVLENGKVLLCDEIDTYLHEVIVYRLIEYFDRYSKQSKAQLLSITHDTNLLDLALFRRDQIWFTELIPETHETDLFSLAEIKNVRKDANIAKGYLSGGYGGIPMLRSIYNSNFGSSQESFDE